MSICEHYGIVDLKPQVAIVRDVRTLGDDSAGLRRLKRALGAELALLRKAAGVTQHHLAHQTGYSRSSITHVEAGRQVLNEDFWRTADKVVKANGVLLSRYRELSQAIRAEEQQQIAALRDGPDRADADQAETSRNFGAIAEHDAIIEWNPDGLRLLIQRMESRPQSHELRPAHHVTTAAHQWLLATPTQLDHATEGGPIGATLLDRVEAIVQELRLIDDHLGGPQVFELVEPEVRFAVRLMKRGSFLPRHRVRLYRLIGELAQLAGWAAHDAGWHRLAHDYYDMSLRAAHLAGDRLLGVYVLSMMAFQASDLGRYQDALLILDSARHGGQHVNTPGVLSMLSAWEARAHSLAGRRAEFYRALGRANDEFTQRTVENDPQWLYWFKQPDSLLEIGRGHSLVGDHGRSLTALGVDTSEIPAELGERDIALYHAYAAEAFVGAGEVQLALEHGHHALDVSKGETLSQRVTDYVSALAQLLHSSGHTSAARSIMTRVKHNSAPR